MAVAAGVHFRLICAKAPHQSQSPTSQACHDLIDRSGYLQQSQFGGREGGGTLRCACVLSPDVLLHLACNISQQCCSMHFIIWLKIDVCKVYLSLSFSLSLYLSHTHTLTHTHSHTPYMPSPRVTPDVSMFIQSLQHLCSLTLSFMQM